MILTCLSVREPWASAILDRGKDVENRVWTTSYRGILGIHAAKTLDGEVPEADRAKLVLGAVLGTVELVDIIQNSKSEWAMAGQYHWIMRNPRRLPSPIPVRGMPGLFQVELPFVGD